MRVAAVASSRSRTRRRRLLPSVIAKPQVVALDWNGSSSTITSRVSTYAQFDYVILAMYRVMSGGSAQFKIDTCNNIRAINPDCKVFNYVVQSEIQEVTTTADDHHDMRLKVDAESWWLRTASGTKTDMFQQAGKKDVNWSSFTTVDAEGLRWPQWKCIRDDAVLPAGSFDGVFLDNMLQRIRADSAGLVGDINLDGTNESVSSNLAANGNVWFTQANEAYIDAHTSRNPTLLRWGNIDTAISNIAFGNKLHGAWCEGMWGASWGSENQASLGFSFCMTHLANLAAQYGKAILAVQSPQSTTDYTTNGPSDTSRRWMRYGLCSALLLDNVLFQMREGGGYGNAPYYHDEYDAPLGNPIEARQSVAGGGWMRRYQYGCVLVNPNGNGSMNTATQGADVTFDLAGEGFRRMSGSQDPTTNNGQAVSSVTLTGRNGLILLRA